MLEILMDGKSERQLESTIFPYRGDGIVNPDPTKMSEPCAIVGQTFQRSPTFWSEASIFTTGELLIYGTNNSGAPSGTP